ncbi:MAG: DUF362 domain-containing protein [Bryobacteraceae bacterium]|nr:DUF362 domain-containing protein [Bryobacteraceae bacterium]
MWNRREFLKTTAQGAAAAATLGAAPAPKPRLGLVASSHPKLRAPSSREDPLDYPRVRDMVWKAIEYGRPAAGSLEAKIKPGSWVVLKPNIISLPPRPTYRTGDVTDLRVLKAVLEYVAERSRAARITVAEGGSYRRRGDPTRDNVMIQNGVQVDALTADWGAEFPGLPGTLGDVLEEARRKFPSKRFDYIDLAYDAVRGPDGEFQWLPVPVSPTGVGAFGEKKVYVTADTVRNCDFLITIPVLKVHLMCGLTACLKNYVGTAPRIAYTRPGSFSNNNLHTYHSLEGRIDSFLVDLAAFHPPDYCVVDAIRGLQYSEHRIARADQEVRSNLILAGEDPVAADALAAYLIGFQPCDIEFLHMASQRGMGVMNLEQADVAGDDPGQLRARWGKPNNWYGRCNRVWRISQGPLTNPDGWERFTSPVDTLHLSQWRAPQSGDTVYRAAVKVIAPGRRKGYLWVGARGRVAGFLNGVKVLAEEGLTRYRPGQFQTGVELQGGENQLLFELTPVDGQADLSALLVGPENDGDSMEGIRWQA